MFFVLVVLCSAVGCVAELVRSLVVTGKFHSLLSPFHLSTTSVLCHPWFCFLYRPLYLFTSYRLSYGTGNLLGKVRLFRHSSDSADITSLTDFFSGPVEFCEIFFENLEVNYVSGSLCTIILKRQYFFCLYLGENCSPIN